MILDRAALTDRIILALTCKTLARKIKCLPGARSIKTETSNTPVYIGVDYVFPKNERKNRPEARLSRTKFAFFSTQRLNLLRLQPAMPPNFRLCWRCLKYTPIWNSTWISTNLTSVFAEPEHKAIITPMLPSRIWAHKRCVDNWKDLREICFNEPGASYISDLTPSSRKFSFCSVIRGNIWSTYTTMLCIWCHMQYRPMQILTISQNFLSMFCSNIVSEISNRTWTRTKKCANQPSSGSTCLVRKSIRENAIYSNAHHDTPNLSERRFACLKESIQIEVILCVLERFGQNTLLDTTLRFS